MTAPKSNDSIQVDALAQALAKAFKANAPTAELLTGMSQERIDRALGRFEKPIKMRVIRCKSVDTKATFDAVVLESRRYKAGRIVRLENYRHPRRAYIEQSQGGAMPDGQIVWKDSAMRSNSLGDDTPKHMLSVQFLQWRYETFWKVDLGRIVGGPLRREFCVNKADFDSEWKTTDMFHEGSFQALAVDMIDDDEESEEEEEEDDEPAKLPASSDKE